MKILLSILLAFCLASPAFSAVLPKPGDPDFFPILAWGDNAWAPCDVTQKYFDDMADAGFTIAGFTNSLATMDLVEKAGMSIWALSDLNRDIIWKEQYDAKRYRDLVAKTIEKFGKHPALYGYFLLDEPEDPWFANIGRAMAEFRKQDSVRPVYLNLLPLAATNELHGTPYRDYLAHSLDIGQAERISYDSYDFLEGSEGLRPSYWEQLKETRAVATQYGVPFHACLQMISHWHYRPLTEAELYFETYSALLYGAKGLAFFTYFPVFWDAGNGMPVNFLGDKTQTWYAIREINHSVLNIARILNRLESTAVYHFQPGTPMLGEDAPAKDSLISGTTNPDLRIAVGEFRDRETGERYLMILNKDMTKSADLNTLQWRNEKPEIINIVSQSKKGVERWFGGLEIWIRPGHAVVAKIVE